MELGTYHHARAARQRRTGSGVAARCGGGTCQNVAWICIIPNPDMLLLHTAVVAQAAAPACLLNYSSCPTSGKYRGSGVVVMIANTESLDSVTQRRPLQQHRLTFYNTVTTL